MRLGGCISFVLVLGACAASVGTGPGKKDSAEADVLTVFVTGNGLGVLKPCGCFGGQLGGLSRRAVIFNRAAESRRLIIDTGAIVAADDEQDLYKFDTTIRAFKLLGYDSVNLRQVDIRAAQSLGLLGSIKRDLNAISAHKVADVNLPAVFSRRMLLGGEAVVVRVASLDVRSGRIEQVEKLLTDSAGMRTVKIVILNDCEPAAVQSIVKKVRFADCVIAPEDSESPSIIGDFRAGPMVVSVGQFGKYIGKLEIRAAKKQGKLKLSFSAVAVSEDLRPDQRIVDLYKHYQQLVRDSGVLERQTRIALPDGLEYVGSQSCKVCHEYEYEQWSTKGHARAYATLERVGSDYDPDCVVCHVVGMRYESGFVSPEQAPGLKDVGCENCHGPGSAHIADLGKTPTGEPKSECIDCHTPDNSGDYSGKEREYFDKIVHWKEPKTAGNVKDNKQTGGSTDK